MKKAFLLLILFFSCFTLNAQKYVFNTLVKYSTRINNSNFEKVYYTNSDNDDYILLLNKVENSFSAFLFDHEKLKKHEFKVIETKSRKDFFFKFEYIKSMEFNQRVKDDFSDFVFVFDSIRINDSIKKVSFKGFKNSINKKPTVEFELEIKNYPKKLFQSFRAALMHSFEYLDYLNYNENGVVVGGTGTTLSGHKAKFKLLELKQVNFELEVKN